LVWQLLDFSTILYGFYKIQSKHTTKEESIRTRVPTTFNLHKSALESNTQVLESKDSHRHVPGGGGKLAASDVGSGLANKYHRIVIGLTLDLLAVVAWPERSSASGGCGVGAARPRRREVRRRDRLG
jgi:hypothetical protein